MSRRRKLAKVERKNDPARVRRKRSQQHTKWLFVGAGALVLAILCLSIGGYLWFRSYLKSEKLREKVETNLGQHYDAKVELSPQSWKGNEVKISRLSLRGNGDLEAVDVSGFSANFDFDQLWNRTIQIDRMQMNQVKVTLDKRTGGSSLQPAPAAAPDGGAEEDSSPSFWQRFAPNQTSLEDIDLGRFNLLVRSDLGNFSLSDSQAEIRPFPGQIDGRRISLSGGRLNFPIGPFPQLDLMNASLRVNPTSTFLSQADLRFGKSGTLSFNGEWQSDASRWNLDGSGDRIDADELLPAAWHASVDGMVRFNFGAKHQQDSGTQWTGDVEIEKGTIKSLDFLDTLAAYTGKIQFRSPSFETASFRFSQTKDQLTLQDLNFYSRNLVRVEGEILIKDELTTGQLMVGIPPGTLSFIPGAETKVFTASHNAGRFGWLWTPVRITEKDGAWTEDLSQRLIQAAGDRLFEVVPETGQRFLKFTEKSAREILKDPVKGGLDAIDEGGSLLQDTVDEGLRVIPGGFLPILPETTPNLEKDGQKSSER